ncbi:6-carboxy-5,6,7,8-tetrahydropterin synthase [Limihaloglobus sulfuriphilus]|uniref:6-carboxy-5,6,7,8-tetrahydropterin synthase n=1 Tax=Limihaloglobus sulfuriphilus TaxID=1851148 RepID=A0A1Q2MCY4_9BACT|nr:6-carboxy-5,6,7,8-tetrahydropterin synthase [Limihaloglobus sulfuriphilus]
MYEVLIEYVFQASHAVCMPAGGLMEDMHSHEWRLKAAFGADKLDENGFAIEFSQAQSLIRDTLSPLEGKVLNNIPVFEGEIPTTEILSRYIYRNLKKRLQSDLKINYIELTEAPGCTVIYKE